MLYHFSNLLQCYILNHNSIRELINAHLPRETVGVGISVEPLEEYEKPRCVLLVEWYGVLNSVSI